MVSIEGILDIIMWNNIYRYFFLGFSVIVFYIASKLVVQLLFLWLGLQESYTVFTGPHLRLTKALTYGLIVTGVASLYVLGLICLKSYNNYGTKSCVLAKDFISNSDITKEQLSKDTLLRYNYDKLVEETKKC